MPAATHPVQFEVNSPARAAGAHKRLHYTATQWAVLAAQAPAALPRWLQPASAVVAAPELARVVSELHAMGVLDSDTSADVSPAVERSLALLAGAPIAVSIIVASSVLSRESWWALDATQLVAAFRRADGGVDWIVAAAEDAAGLMSAAVPEAYDLVPQDATGGGIAAALGLSAPEAAPRERFSLPLALLGKPDPLAPGAEQPAGCSRADREAAAAFVASVRGTLTARVQSLAWAGQQLRPAVGQQVWFATSDGWWSTSAEPRGSRTGDSADRRVRLTPVQPAHLAASLAPMLTSAFSELAAVSWRSRARAVQVDQSAPTATETDDHPETPAPGSLP